MSDIFDSADQKKKEDVSMKSGEITGKQHLFHSLPKEFQNWHAIHYQLEKEGDVDPNTISLATLNAYMWKTFFDGSFYGIAGSSLIISTIIIDKFIIYLGYPFLGFFSWLIFLFSAIYLSYHFYFYGKIRAQVIGKLTYSMAKNTSFLFYQTSASIFFSLVIVMLFSFLILETIQELLVYLILISGQESVMGKILITMFNFLNWVVYTNGDSGQADIIFDIVLYSGILTLICFFVENNSYRSFREVIVKGMSVAKMNAKFPIEKSQQVITAWRKRNGI